MKKYIIVCLLVITIGLGIGYFANATETPPTPTTVYCPDTEIFVAGATACSYNCQNPNEVCTFVGGGYANPPGAGDNPRLNLCQCRPRQCGNSAAPQCNGTCPGGQTCQQSTTSMIATCECVIPCDQTVFPQCSEGSCPEGQICESTGDSCQCEALPPPPPPSQQDCELSEAPACGGMCDDSTQVCRILESDGACHCLEPLPPTPAPEPDPTPEADPAPAVEPPPAVDIPPDSGVTTDGNTATDGNTVDGSNDAAGCSSYTNSVDCGIGPPSCKWCPGGPCIHPTLSCP